MDLLYLHISYTAPVMSYPLEEQTALAPSCWITNTWQFMTQLEATLVSNTMRLHPQREHDKALLMESSTSYSGTHKQRINAIRLYLKVFFLSDIVDSSGHSIDVSYTDPNQQRHRTTSLNWPNQHLPPPKAWSDWRSFLRKQFCYPCTLRLRYPLGHWLNPPHSTQHWQTLVNPITNTVYIRTPDPTPTWTHWQPLPRSRH